MVVGCWRYARACGCRETSCTRLRGSAMSARAMYDPKAVVRVFPPHHLSTCPPHTCPHVHLSTSHLSTCLVDQSRPVTPIHQTHQPTHLGIPRRRGRSSAAPTRTAPTPTPSSRRVSEQCGRCSLLLLPLLLCSAEIWVVSLFVRPYTQVQRWRKYSCSARVGSVGR